ncbi:hypothetical protein SRHO_G00002630 [Serrasalmus rhombeus]
MVCVGQREMDSCVALIFLLSTVTLTTADWFGEGSGRIWADVFDCQGNETHLSECPISSWSRTACSHRQDAGVICSGSSLVLHEGRVRLSGGMECEGKVEVFFMQDWRRVLLDSWSESEASVVCRQLGCGSVFSFSSSSTSSPEHSHMCVTGFNCTGGEAHLGNCSNAEAVNCSSREQLSISCSAIRLLCGEDECGHKEDVGVVCSEYKEIRLTEGCEGNLEVFYNGTWGNVCENGMTEDTVNLICQDLNCGKSGIGMSGQARVESAPTWLGDLKCRKYDSTLWHCPSSPWGQNYCESSNDMVHITCSDKGSSPAHSTCFLSLNQQQCSNHLPLRLKGTEGSFGQPVKKRSTPPRISSPAIPSIYSAFLLVLAVLLFLALVLLVVLFYQNRVLRRGLSKRRCKSLTEVVYEEIDRRYITKGNDLTQRGSVLSEEQHSGYENVDEELLSGESAKEDTAESYITAGQISDSVAEVAENYDDVITADQSSAVVTDMTDIYDDAVTAGPNSNIMTVDTPENYDDVIRAKQDAGGIQDHGDEEYELHAEMNPVTKSTHPVSFLRKLHSNQF